MAFSLKTWVNRISEYPNRRKLTHEDGSTELVTVARAEGQISAEGNAFSAEEMNDLENRIKGGFDEVNQSLTELNEGSVRFSTFEGTVDNWGSIGIVYPSDAHMLIGAYSSDYLLVPETHNPSVKFDSFRCFGRLQVQQLAIAPGGTKIKGWFYYI